MWRAKSIVGDENWDARERAELRFLAPFERETPRELEWLWGFSYGADGTWRVAEARRATRCWRGHHLESYSAQLCP